MLRSFGVNRYLPAAFATCLVVVCMTPALAHGETYGQQARFGATGTGHGEFDIRKGDNAFGVDPTDNSVYVGDEPGSKKGEYRIQKLTSSGQFVAETALFKPAGHLDIEGIAVDAGEKRIYALVTEARSAGLTLDPNVPAAGTLYAFSTEPIGETLVPAPGTNAEGVLAGPSVFESQSDVSGRALLNPKGIAVDPASGEVVVLGEIEREVEKGSEESPTLVALQRILPNGTLGERYVDTSEFFGPETTPGSPVVSASGTVYMDLSQPQIEKIKENGRTLEKQVFEIVQIPKGSTAPPTPVVQYYPKGELESEELPLIQFEQGEPATYGDGLSLTPEGPDGGSAMYVKAGIFVRPGATGGAFYPGALAFSQATGSELGWTGGQTAAAGKSCTIGFGAITYSWLAAGGKGVLFMFDPPTGEVVVFGPGGSGCPAAQATEPSAELDGKALAPGETVSAGVPVTFSSTMTQANAVSVEWSFGDGQTTSVSADEYLHTEVTHSFVRGGELTVTETIHTDDLATPTIVKQTKISVSATTPPPTAVLEGPTEVTLGPTELERLVYLPGGELGVEKITQDGLATFNASASTASTTTGPNQITEYHWVFGDGESKTTDTDTVEHAYTKPESYVVQLTVTDAFEHTSEPVRLTVKVKEPPPPPPKVTGGSGAPSVSTPPTPTTSTGQTSTTTGKQGSTPVPDAHLVSKSITISSSGAVNLGVSCPTGEANCTGTVILRTLKAVIPRTGGSRSKKKAKAIILTLANGAFAVTGGNQKSLTLHLTPEARALLASMHVLRVQATLVAHDPSGKTHTTRTDVTLRASKSTRRRHK
jgi:PKD repeat protein